MHCTHTMLTESLPQENPCPHLFLQRACDVSITIPTESTEFPPTEKMRVAASGDGRFFAAFAPPTIWYSGTEEATSACIFMHAVTGGPTLSSIQTPQRTLKYRIEKDSHVVRLSSIVTANARIQVRTGKTFHADIGYVTVDEECYLIVAWAQVTFAQVLSPVHPPIAGAHPAALTRTTLLRPGFMCTTIATCGNKVAMVVHRRSGDLDVKHGHVALETVTVDIVQLAHAPLDTNPRGCLQATPFRRVCSVDGPRCWAEHKYTCLAFRPDGGALVFSCPAGGSTIYMDSESDVARDDVASPPRGDLPPEVQTFDLLEGGIVPTAACFWRGNLLLAAAWNALTCSRCTERRLVSYVRDTDAGIVLVDIGAYDVCADPVLGLIGVTSDGFGPDDVQTESLRQVSVYLSTDCITQMLMSPLRVAWMTTVVRGASALPSETVEVFKRRASDRSTLS